MTETDTPILKNLLGEEEPTVGEDCRIDRQMEAAREHIRRGKAIKGFSKYLDHEFWLREVIRDIDSENPNVRSRALAMLGQYLGVLSDRKSRHRKAKVVFDEE